MDINIINHEITGITKHHSIELEIDKKPVSITIAEMWNANPDYTDFELTIIEPENSCIQESVLLDHIQATGILE